MNKRSLIRVLLPLLILLLAGGVAFSMVSSTSERTPPRPAEKVWQVDVMTVSIDALAPALVLYGEVESSALLKASAPGAGVVEKLNVQPGDAIRSGQVLLEMDQRDFISAQLQAQADVDDVRAQLAEHELKYLANQKSLQQEKTLLQLAIKEVQRMERLKNKNLSSESALSNAYEMLGRQELAVIARQLEVDKFGTGKKQLQARLARAEARLQQAQLAVERSRVMAEFDGVVAEVAVASGDRVRNGDHLLSLYSLDTLRVRGSIPMRYQQEIQQALDAGQSLLATARLAGRNVRLKLQRLAGAATLSGIDGYFSIEQGADSLRVGNLLKLELLRPLQTQVIAVPFTAIYGNNRVFVLRDGRMVAIDVESVGQFQNAAGTSLLLVRSAQINSGDKIIITHLPNAVDGLKVKVVRG
jgi:multidrug efflux pump subunit AcrA (membrane-fusion protein)